MQKIIITGGLGYIGTELCKLYSGESRYKKIIVIDSRFLAERVKQLRDWGIEFIQGDILDKETMKSILTDASLVYHLAGITDVAYTKTESDTEKDKQIQEVGVIGTRNIIELSSKETKIIFPSTHVVYEGFSETKFNIAEDTEPAPVLTYSKGKAQSEKDLIESEKNYIILRLGSVYGYSTDTMRINIMPNLFSKITSQNGTLKLFSGGVQHKSLVALLDVVRAMKFMGESDINKEVFHLTNENTTIKSVAKLCKKINHNVKIIETKDEIPNLGYTLSNKKILRTGFKFLYNLENSLREMVINWSKRDQNADLEYIIRGDKEYIDDRGKISNYELTEPINLIGYIESKTGTMRANHYHPIQEQKCLIISGKYISVTKDLANPESPIETKLIKAGDLSIIKPNVAHTMVFLEDTVFLNLVRGEREHNNYGITHTIPYKLVDNEFKKDLLENYKTECRSCENTDLTDVISLGLSPLANNLLENPDEKTNLFPLEMKYCGRCHNCQLSFTVPAQKLFDHYLYVSSTTKTFKEHFQKTAEKYVKQFKLTKKDLVVDIGSNDGIALKPLQEKGVKVLGIEPAKNICAIANKNGIETINAYFNEKVVDKIIKTKGKATLVTASNVFAHSDFLKDIAVNVFKLLKKDGQFIVEVQYILDTINDLTFDNIYHEHVDYWSVTSINNFFNGLKLKVCKVEHIDTHGGSIRVYVKKDGKIDPSVKKFLDAESKFGIKNILKYKDFGDSIRELKETVTKNIKILKNNFKSIVGYGSPAKATTTLNYFNINEKYIDYTIEDNELKNGKFIPGVKIPIKSKGYAYENLPQVIIVLAWNFFEVIKQNNIDLIKKGVIFINIKDLQKKDFKIPKK